MVIGFEHSKADPCVFCKVVAGEAEIMVVEHVVGILSYAKDQVTIDRFAVELGQKFKLKDTSDARYYMGCHITTKNDKAQTFPPSIGVVRPSARAHSSHSDDSIACR